MTTATAGTSPGVRMLMWTLLIVYILNFLDRQIVNILAEEISRDLKLSDAQIGLMTGLAFAAEMRARHGDVPVRLDLPLVALPAEAEVPARSELAALVQGEAFFLADDQHDIDECLPL